MENLGRAIAVHNSKNNFAENQKITKLLTSFELKAENDITVNQVAASINDALK